MARSTCPARSPARWWSRLRRRRSRAERLTHTTHATPPTLRLRPRRVPRLPAHLARAAARALAADGGDERDLGDLARRITRRRGSGPQPPGDDPRLHGRRLRDDERRRRLPDHGSHAGHVSAGPGARKAGRGSASGEREWTRANGRGPVTSFFSLFPSSLPMRQTVTQLSYLVAAILFVLGLKSLTRPDQARRGMRQAAVGMLLAIVGTLIQQQIVDYRWIAIGLVVGGVVGYPLGMWVPMTAMPQRIAIALCFGATAATLVGIAEYSTTLRENGTVGAGKMAALGFEVMLGALTVTGAFIAFGKLQEFITGRPVTYRGQNVVNVVLLAVLLGLFAYLIANPERGPVFYTMIGLAALIGVML